MTTALRPLSTGELLDRTFSLYRDHFGLFIGIFALPHLIVFLFQLGGVVLQTSSGNELSRALIMMFSGFGVLILTVIVSAASQAGTVVAVSNVYLDRPASISDSFSKVKGEILGVIGVSMLVGLGVAVGAIALIIPGIILLTMWSLSVPVKILEGKGVTDSMTRSSDLTKGDRWRVFLVWLLFAILSVGFAMLLQWPVEIAAGVTSRGALARTSAGWQTLSLASQFVSECLVGPLGTIAFCLIYYDERVRKEAFDLDLMMATLDTPAIPAPAVQAGA